MKAIIVKYKGTCSKCSATLEVGRTVGYEKITGIFCPSCIPNDPEEIRAYRQKKADAKADKYEEWADKRDKGAREQLDSYATLRHDISFITQPGPIPLRTRIIKADDKAYRSMQTADGFRDKADSLRNSVQVAGDKESYRQAKRDDIKSQMGIGTHVRSSYGLGVITKINKKTARVCKTRENGDEVTLLIDLSLLHIVEDSSLATNK